MTKRRGSVGNAMEASLLRAINSGKLIGGAVLDSTPRLAERYGISLVTAQKVLRKLGNAGYLVRRNGAPTIVAQRPMQTVGLAMPHMGADFTLAASEMHYLTVSGALSICARHGLNMNIVHTMRTGTDPRRFDSLGLRGLLILYPCDDDRQLLETLEGIGLPMVCINLLNPAIAARYRTINFNYASAGAKAWKYFRGHGSGHPAFFAQTPLSQDEHRAHLWAGFRDAAADDGVTAVLAGADVPPSDGDSSIPLMRKNKARIERELGKFDAILFGETQEAELYRSWGHVDQKLCGFFVQSPYFPSFQLDYSGIGAAAMKMLLTGNTTPCLKYCELTMTMPEQ